MAITIVTPSVTPVFGGVCPSDEVSMLKHIEECGRICYRSEHLINETSYEGFYQRIVRAGHTSVLGHGNVCLHITYTKHPDMVAPYKFSPWKSIAWLATALQRRDYFVINTCKPNKSTAADIVFEAYMAGSLRAWVECLSVVQNHTFVGHIVFKHAYPLVSKLTFGESFFKRIPELNTSICTVEVVPIEDQLLLLKDNNWDLPQFSFRFLTDRGISHELVRHQTLAVSQESTRYVNYDKKIGFRFVDNTADGSLEVHQHLMKSAELYTELLSQGIKPQIARDVLTTSLATELVMSGRWGHIDGSPVGFEMCKGWSHFILKRDSPAAHPGARVLAAEVRKYFEDCGICNL